jgi:chemotaxis regulatin CheY-phosphate phosphatase CheZ
METGRGRWFLAEYARRNRHSDTMTLLGAIDRLEAAIRGERTAQSLDRIRFELFEMAKAITRTKAEIAAIKPDIRGAGKFGEMTAELDSLMQTTEMATSDILAAAEQIQGIAWTLREHGIDPEVCDLIHAKATDVYTACSVQDLTGQRIAKLIQVLRYLEGRINAMIDIWGFEGEPSGKQAARPDAAPAALMGPAKIRLDQLGVDLMMAPAEADDADQSAEYEPAANGYRTPMAQKPASAASAGLEAQMAKPHAAEPPPARSPDDPLRPILALSAEEKIALFS